MFVPFEVYKRWKENKDNWEELCNCCGKCCYLRTVNEDGSVNIHYDTPCKLLDKETNMCLGYEERFEITDHCAKLGLFSALFDKTIPHDCPYVTTFRVWLKDNEK